MTVKFTAKLVVLDDQKPSKQLYNTNFTRIADFISQMLQPADN